MILGPFLQTKIYDVDECSSTRAVKMNEADNDDFLDLILIKLLQEKKPTTVKQLVNQTRFENPSIPEEKILQHILILRTKGKLKLNLSDKESSQKLIVFIKTRAATWYWITIILSLFTALTIFSIPNNSFPLFFLRNILGIIFVMFLPGHSLVKTLFPTKELDFIEYVGLALGLSLALVPIVGLILRYTIFDLELTTLTISLLILTISLSTIAILREYKAR